VSPRASSILIWLGLAGLLLAGLAVSGYLPLIWPELGTAR
jgi:hypothetical protein